MLRLSRNGRANDNLGLFIHNGAADYSRVILPPAERLHRTKGHEKKRAIEQREPRSVTGTALSHLGLLSIGAVRVNPKGSTISTIVATFKIVQSGMSLKYQSVGCCGHLVRQFAARQCHEITALIVRGVRSGCAVHLHFLPQCHAAIGQSSTRFLRLDSWSGVAPWPAGNVGSENPQCRISTSDLPFAGS